jgi:hypothetical protein
MLQLSAQSVIYVATISIDFRKGIDGIVGVCKKELSIDPFSGSLFLFYNRSKTTIKILFYDGQGFILYTKRLSQGRFQYNNSTATPNLSYQQICHRALQVLINNGNLQDVKFSKDWRPIVPHLPQPP